MKQICLKKYEKVVGYKEYFYEHLRYLCNMKKLMKKLLCVFLRKNIVNVLVAGVVCWVMYAK